MERRANPYAILRNWDFYFILTGRFVASFGQQMLTVAVGWELYERTRSSLALGLVGLTAFLPQVVMTLPAGHVADTRERKKVIIAMQAVLAMTSLGLALVSWRQAPVLWVYICPLGGGRGADVFVVGQRVVFAAVGGAQGIPAGHDVVCQHLSILRRDRPGGGRRLDCADPQRRGRLCGQRRRGRPLPGDGLHGARPPQTAGEGAIFDQDGAGRISILSSATASFWA